ncbi:hypothetical protein IAQ61_004790, partial [Plenodomus lingam]|uniref:Predicted protein n=1 Tax=Leptosphaeria maculans (strain JN3 / isolate v23.1.3 / race Av1-4-5-6-7-8) TaxID=985895 RepID=E4ZWI7_LEPMJ
MAIICVVTVAKTMITTLDACSGQIRGEARLESYLPLLVIVATSFVTGLTSPMCLPNFFPTLLALYSKTTKSFQGLGHTLSAFDNFIIMIEDGGDSSEVRVASQLQVCTDLRVLPQSNDCTLGIESPENCRNENIEIHVPATKGPADVAVLSIASIVFGNFSPLERGNLNKNIQNFLSGGTFRNNIADTVTLSPPSRDRGSRPATSSLFYHCLHKRGPFRFMELPIEVRLMISKHALHVPEGLSFIWRNYRSGHRVGTMKGYQDQDLPIAMLESINALPRTCRALYNETSGLVFRVNLIKFNVFSMYQYSIPKRCRAPESDLQLRAGVEALGFLRRFAPALLWPAVNRIEMNCINMDALISEWIGQLDSVSYVTHRCIVSVHVSDWSMKSLDAWEFADLEENMKELEIAVHVQNHMQAQATRFIETALLASNVMRCSDDAHRRWRIFPAIRGYKNIGSFTDFFSRETLRAVEDWYANGIGTEL